MNHQLKFKNMRTGDKVFDIVNYTLLTLIMVIVLYPVLYIVAASFSDPQAVSVNTKNMAIPPLARNSFRESG